MATSGAIDGKSIESLKKEIECLKSKVESLEKLVEVVYCMIQEDYDDGEGYAFEGFNT